MRQRLDALPRASRGDLEARLKRLGARLAELRDWRGFVAGPKRTQLIDSIEALAEDDTLPDADRDRRHRQLIKEWAALGDAAATAELSQRFRSTSQRIHDALADWYHRRDDERKRNLEAREALCEQLEELIAHPDSRADPDIRARSATARGSSGSSSLRCLASRQSRSANASAVYVTSCRR